MKPQQVHCDGVASLREFPGEIAGASLKRKRAGLGARRRSAEFPGEIAGASLKPLPALPGGRPRAANSPAKSPGPH